VSRDALVLALCDRATLSYRDVGRARDGQRGLRP